MPIKLTIRRKGQIEPKADRAAYAKYCAFATSNALARSRKTGVPFSIDAHYVDKLLVDQGWCCAFSGVPLDAPNGTRRPFGPSLDRIVPKLGYVPGNLRIVCHIVNCALNNWGEKALFRLTKAMVLTGVIHIDPEDDPW